MSRKQEIYAEMIWLGFVALRAICGSGASVGWDRQECEQGWSVANLLHNASGSILLPEYTDNDINFINLAIPHYLEGPQGIFEHEFCRLLIEFHDLVPDELRAQITWHPSEELRRAVERPLPKQPS
jgi:hypothetical protein